MRRTVLCVLVAAFAAATAALPAAAKEGVVATLETPIPLDAEPGTPVRVAWTLTYAEGESRGRPFGASGVFVRLVSASGANAQTGVAVPAPRSSGKYEATVKVPAGGIGDVQVGLHGWVSAPSGTRSADRLFPITNDPVPGTRLAAPGDAGKSRGDRGAATVLGAVAVLLLAATAVVALTRRRRPSPA